MLYDKTFVTKSDILKGAAFGDNMFGLVRMLVCSVLFVKDAVKGITIFV